MANTVDIMSLIQAAQQGNADFLALNDARNGASPEMQKVLAPLEHRAFTKGLVSENPLMAIPMAVATPAYTAGKVIAKGPTAPGPAGIPYNMIRELTRSKKLGLQNTRSPASVEEMKQGYIGILEGLLSKLGGGVDKSPDTKDEKGNPKNTQFDLNNSADVAAMLKAVSPEYNTPTKQLGDGTPYGPGAFAKMLRLGKTDPRLNRSRAEEVAKYREGAGLPSAEQILTMIYTNNPKLASMIKKGNK